MSIYYQILELITTQAATLNLIKIKCTKKLRGKNTIDVVAMVSLSFKNELQIYKNGKL